MNSDEIETLNDKHFKESKQQFEEFRNAILKHKCSLCGNNLNYFNEQEPCLHWLLAPKDFEKKHLLILNLIFGHERIQSFLRWYVNSFELFTGINDLKEEHKLGKITAVTIKHGNLEWSFDMSKEDFEGHRGWPPHYHLQMRIDDKRFITFGEFHLPLSDYDQWCINVRLNKIPGIKYREFFGAGVEGILDNEFIDPNNLLRGMRSVKDESKAAFSISTFIEAEPGHTISGDDLAKLIEEHNKTGLSMAHLSSKLKDVKTQIIIGPGDGVPVASERKSKRNKKSSRRKNEIYKSIFL